MVKKDKKKEQIILEELQLLEKMRKEHEWIVVGQKEAEEEEKAEAELGSEAYHSQQLTSLQEDSSGQSTLH